jgi:hypothetical protein
MHMHMKRACHNSAYNGQQVCPEVPASGAQKYRFGSKQKPLAVEYQEEGDAFLHSE